MFAREKHFSRCKQLPAFASVTLWRGARVTLPQQSLDGNVSAYAILSLTVRQILAN